MYSIPPVAHRPAHAGALAMPATGLIELAFKAVMISIVLCLMPGWARTTLKQLLRPVGVWFDRLHAPLSVAGSLYLNCDLGCAPSITMRIVSEPASQPAREPAKGFVAGNMERSRSGP